MRRVVGMAASGSRTSSALMWSALGLVCLVTITRPAPAYAQAAGGNANAVLVLYDAPPGLQWLGELYAAQLTNLLGHFNFTVTRSPVESYQDGQMGNFRTTFYIGSVFGNPVPPAFLADVRSERYTVCWLKYNLEQLAWTVRNFQSPLQPVATLVPLPVAGAMPRPTAIGSPPAPTALTAVTRATPVTQAVPDPVFEAQFGFRFQGLDRSGYEEVLYRGGDFTRDLRDPEIGLIAVHDTDRVQTPAWLRRDATGAMAPYVIDSAGLWYVVDIPFSFVSETDRYLAFADVLHDIVGINHAAAPRAMVRLEDIDPSMPVELLQGVTSYLESQEIPYGLSVVPKYVDPNGFYSEGVSESSEMKDAPVNAELERAEGLGMPVFQHGFTHQYNNVLNPITAVTGDDFEFFRVTLNPNLTLNYLGPVAEDSPSWARSRVRDGQHGLGRAGLHPVGWETPHYAASQDDYLVFAQDFPLAWERSLYFSAPITTTQALTAARAWAQRRGVLLQVHRQGENVVATEPAGVTADPASTNNQAFAGQFFPYPIVRDVYGRQLLPENLGHLDPNGFLAFPPRFPADVLDAARRNLALREPWGVFFFHPFVDPALLREVVDGLRALGYQFVNPMQAAPADTGAPQ